MPLPATSKLLIGVHSMRLEPLVSAHDAPEQCDGCVDKEKPTEYSPGLQRNCAKLIGRETKHGQSESKKSTPDISHEYARRRPVPTQKSQTRRGETEHGCRQSGVAAMRPIQECAGTA